MARIVGIDLPREKRVVIGLTYILSLIHIQMCIRDRPRVRDFRGVSPKSFDGRGNYSLGLKEQLIFPEIEYDKIDKLRGMEIVFATTAKTDEEGRALLKLLGLSLIHIYRLRSLRRWQNESYFR